MSVKKVFRKLKERNEKRYNADQARDSHGRFGEGGSNDHMAAMKEHNEAAAAHHAAYDKAYNAAAKTNLPVSKEAVAHITAAAAHSAASSAHFTAVTYTGNNKVVEAANNKAAAQASDKAYAASKAANKA